MNPNKNALFFEISKEIFFQVCKLFLLLKKNIFGREEMVNWVNLLSARFFSVNISSSTNLKRHSNEKELRLVFFFFFFYTSVSSALDIWTSYAIIEKETVNNPST